MREIKFRAWDGWSRKMMEVEQLNFSPNIEGVNINDLPRQKHLILMQYTGLLDKNGVEIFEGDIVKEYDNFGYKVLEVYYDQDNVEFELKRDHEKGGSYHTPLYREGAAKYCEVIGNIYENPELLNAS